MDFWRRDLRTQWKFNLGVPLYYHLLGRKLFGPEIKYPLFRLAHLPEGLLRRKLYLDFTGRMRPRHQVPAQVPVPN